MSNFYKDTMNIPIVGAEYGFNGVVDPEYARGHRAALIAASKIALDADVRVNSLETDLAAANAEITRLRAGGCAREQGTTQWCGEMQKLVGRLTKLAEEWNAEDYYDKGRRETLDWCTDRPTEAIAAHSGEGE